MAIGRLERKPSLPHSYFHDLESLFYVLCWISTLYSGPNNKERTFNSALLYRQTEVARWNGDNSGQHTMAAICSAKGQWIAKYEGFEKTIKQFSTYFEPIFGCLENLQELLFKGSVVSKKDREEKEELARSLDEEVDLLKEGDLIPQPLIQRSSDIPIRMRPYRIVVQSFWDVFREMEMKLPNETIPNNDNEAVVKKQVDAPAPRKLRHFVEEIVPGALGDVDRDEEVICSRYSSETEEELYEGTGAALEPPNHSFNTSATRVNIHSSLSKRKLQDEVEGEPRSPKRSKNHKLSGVHPPDIIPRRSSRTRAGQGISKDHDFAMPAPRMSGRNLRSASRRNSAQRGAK